MAIAVVLQCAYSGDVELCHRRVSACGGGVLRMASEPLSPLEPGGLAGFNEHVVPATAAALVAARYCGTGGAGGQCALSRYAGDMGMVAQNHQTTATAGRA